MKHLANKVAIVTGSTSGIGRAIAEQLARSGCHMVLNGFGDNTNTLCDEIRTTHRVEVLYHGADLTRVADMEDLVHTVSAQWGRIDILINNAGMQHVAPIDTFPVDQWDKIIALNLSAPFHMTRLCIPFMKRQKWGRIVHVGSVNGIRAVPYKSAYVTSKHGLAGLCKTTALEVATDNITVNTICPAFVKTPLVKKQITDTAKAYNITEQQAIEDIILGSNPSKEFITLEQVVNYVDFLCSDKASAITGVMHPIDGGKTI